jgi:hypothetical protein
MTYQSFYTYWTILELGIFRSRFTDSQVGSGLKGIDSEWVSPGIQINSGEEAHQKVRDFSAFKAFALGYREEKLHHWT